MALARGRPGSVARHISSQAHRCLSPGCIRCHLGISVTYPCSCVSFSSSSTSTSILETSTARSESRAVATARSVGGDITASTGVHALFLTSSDPSRDLSHILDERSSELGFKGVVVDNAAVSTAEGAATALCGVESDGGRGDGKIADTTAEVDGEGAGNRRRRKPLFVSSLHSTGAAAMALTVADAVDFSSSQSGINNARVGTVTGISCISGLPSFSVPPRVQQHQQQRGSDGIERHNRSCARRLMGGWQGGGADQRRFFATAPKPPKQYLRYIHRVKPAENSEEAYGLGDGMDSSPLDGMGEIQRARVSSDDLGDRMAGLEAVSKEGTGGRWGRDESEDGGELEVNASKKSSEMTRKWLKGFKAEDILRDKSLLRQQLEVRGNCTVDEAITMFVNQRATSFIVVNRRKEVIGMFTSRDLLSELARYPNKADGLKTKAHEFMIPLSRMIYCSMKDSLYQCLLVMSELKVRNLPVVSEGKVMGIVNVNDISDFSFSMEELGGKKAYMKNISERKGLPKGVGLDPKQNRAGWKQTFSASVGTVALPHPHKLPDGRVSANQREHRHLEVADDPTLSEDAHFILDVAWPTETTDTVNYVGIADGVGSWRRVGVDPRAFSQRLMHWAREYILSMAPGSRIGGHGHLSPRPPKPHEVLMAAWEYTIGEKVVGSSTACVAALDYDLEQLTFSNIGDCGVVVLRHIDSDVAGYMREKQTPRHLRNSDLRLAFISQQQLRSFNLPYQFGYTNVPEDNANFETPRDAVNTSFPVRPGDIIILATDGLFDNMELDDICAMALEWEYKWFGGEMMGLGEHNNAAVRDLATQLGRRARELSLDNTRDSPFALLAKENDIMWGGGMPDDITVVALRVINKADSPAAAVSTRGLGTDDHHDHDEAAA